MPSLVWLEQIAPGRFERHTLEQGAYLISLDLADYDRNGDPDIVIGHFQTSGGPSVEVSQNLTRMR
jgi:hypothetical protein